MYEPNYRKEPPVQRITFEIEVPGFATWATGTIRGSRSKILFVEEEPTVMGGIRAINEAVARAEASGGAWVRAEAFSPRITPNPAEQGWPLGVMA